MKNLRPAPVLLIVAVALLVLPPLLFLGSALYRGMGLADGTSALLEQYSAERTNLVVITLLGLLPLLLVTLLLGIRRMLFKTWDDAGLYALCSSLPIVLVTVFVHLEYWPSWLPARQFLGFPHGLEFVIGPFVFAPVGVLLGFVTAWLIARSA
jgi:hypothetical protein